MLSLLIVKKPIVKFANGVSDNEFFRSGSFASVIPHNFQATQ